MQGDTRVRQMQDFVWSSASVVEAIGIALFLDSQADLSEPAIRVICAAAILACVWATRRWVLSTFTAEKFEELARTR